MYTVIYRRGGYLNATWHPTTPVCTRDEAIKRTNEVEKMGYKTITFNTVDLERLGMPVGYCSQCNSQTGECTNRGKECSK